MFKCENSDKVIADKFERELNAVQQDLIVQPIVNDGEEQEERKEDNFLTFERMIILLQKMGFYPEKHDETGYGYQADQALLQDLWKLVRGEKYAGVTVDTLKVLMMNWVGVKVINREGVPEESEENKGETTNNEE